MDRTTRHLTAIEQAVDRLFRLGAWAACCTLLACVTVLAGCQPFDHYDKRLYGPSTPGLEPPRELAKVSMPIYRIEPPDIVQIEVAKLVPLPPYHIDVFDLLQISVIGTLPEQPINGLFLVDSEGRVELGPGYRRVRVAGLTVDQASQTIEAHLREFLRTPEVSVQLARPSNLQQVSGQYLVAADGTINLRQYGLVPLAGRTVFEARAAVEQQLSQFFQSPKVSLDVVAYNSKVYYIVTQGAAIGDNVVRVPITGNETVLDAICQVHGLSQVSSKRVWISRPAPFGFHCEQVLPVDWDAITQGASVATNYQVLPGDRVFIASDNAVTLTAWINKTVAPVERVAGFLSLGFSTIQLSHNLNTTTNGGIP
jgi:polysaccharide export outer membrane protein